MLLNGGCLVFAFAMLAQGFSVRSPSCGQRAAAAAGARLVAPGAPRAREARDRALATGKAALPHPTVTARPTRARRRDEVHAHNMPSGFATIRRLSTGARVYDCEAGCWAV